MAGSQIGVFFKQPARISRLAMRYLAEGNFKSFYTLLGYTAVVGGATASIPLELQIAGQVINPESYFKAAAAADQCRTYTSSYRQEAWTLGDSGHYSGHPGEITVLRVRRKRWAA